MILSKALIESEYEKLGHTLGWRFLTCPEQNISTATTALVTINPGGSSYEPPAWSVESGSAYVVESWKDYAPGQEKLQLQVQRMFQVMGMKPEQVLSGYLVPFRSSGWAELPRKSESLRFGASLWREVFKRANIDTVVSFGKDTATYMAELLEAEREVPLPAGWGSLTIDRYRFGTGGRLIVIPHLSRFGLFGRPNSESQFRTAMELIETPQIGNVPAVRTGRFSPIIRLLVSANPKRGKSRFRFDCYRDGMTVAATNLGCVVLPQACRSK